MLIVEKKGDGGSEPSDVRNDFRSESAAISRTSDAKFTARPIERRRRFQLNITVFPLALLIRRKPADKETERLRAGIYHRGTRVSRSVSRTLPRYLIMSGARTYDCYHAQ